jgi:hypothetical protein
MLQKELNQDSIRQWAEKLDDNKKIIQMTKDQAIEFQKILLVQNDIDSDSVLLKRVEEKKMGIASLIYLRAKYIHTFKLHMSVVMLLGVICKSPGDCVIYLNYIQYKSHLLGIKDIDSNVFCTKLFPMGILSEQTLKESWDAQKVQDAYINHSSDNMLDYVECGKSIAWS